MNSIALLPENATSIGQSLRWVAGQLEDSPSSYLDAQVLLAEVTKRPRPWLLAHPEAPLSESHLQAIDHAVSRLRSGIPLPYVIGHWEFYNLCFHLEPTVLIPRPETELLVDQAIQWLRHNPSRRHVADIGTGSGCIAISLAVNIPDLRATAVDISPAALAVARHNARWHGVHQRVAFVASNLFSSLATHAPRFDLICANLPYIPTPTLKTLKVFGREPRQALDGGKDGLDLIREFLRQAPDWISPGGILLLEIEARQGEAAAQLAQASFPQASIAVFPDLAGQDRLLRIETPSN